MGLENRFNSIGKSVKKNQSTAYLLGKPVFLEDVVSKDALIVKLLRSPHPNAIVDDIDTSIAEKIPGVEAIFTWKDVPKTRFAIEGHTYPEPTPYDRLILDRHVRYVGDPVAIVVAKDDKTAIKATKLIKVKYNVLEPLLDFTKAIDNPVIVHPEDDWLLQIEEDPLSKGANLGASNKRNIVTSNEEIHGNLEDVLASCDEIIEHTYYTKSFNQTPAEPFCTYTEIDAFGNLHVITSTQILFHCRRILARALEIPVSKIYVEQPRIGGGFGAKGSTISELYPAFATWMTGKPCKIVFTRHESQIAGSPRHAAEMKIRLGAMKDGTIRAIDLQTVFNAGAYGEHSSTALLSVHNTLPLYTANMEAFRCAYTVVYTNLVAAGAYRGYGVPQGLFALESAVNELAETLGIDPTEIRYKNMVREGMTMLAYSTKEVANACALDKCMTHCKEIFNWDEKYPVRDMGNGRVRAAGVAMAMQGSGIATRDTGSIHLKLLEDGTFYLANGASDLGTGSDTILAQIAAECLECDIANIQVYAPGTDFAPYDSGSYASAVTYVTGQATVKACRELKKRICGYAADFYKCSIPEVEYKQGFIRNKKTGEAIDLKHIALKAQYSDRYPLEVISLHCSPISPPPYMVGMVEIELDKLTGHVEIIDYKAVVDSGTIINPALARIQAEGGIVQAIGHTLTENVTYTENGELMQNSFLQYKIPTRLDMGHLQVEFESSYEPSGPFGAKSIGEIVIDTPAPAIAHAIFRATGVWHRELPITPEKIAMSLKK